ncbi:MAG: DUF3310 domain-containing protein [Candidatus Dojkabacteria bacterium]
MKTFDISDDVLEKLEYLCEHMSVDENECLRIITEYYYELKKKSTSDMLDNEINNEDEESEVAVELSVILDELAINALLNMTKNKDIDEFIETLIYNQFVVENKLTNTDVSRQSHYASQSIQPIEYMMAVMTPEQFVGYLWGNVIKYDSRWGKKNGVEDLNKSEVYRNWLVEFLNTGKITVNK